MVDDRPSPGVVVNGVDGVPGTGTGPGPGPGLTMGDCERYGEERWEWGGAATLGGGENEDAGCWIRPALGGAGENDDVGWFRPALGGGTV